MWMSVWLLQRLSNCAFWLALCHNPSTPFGFFPISSQSIWTCSFWLIRASCSEVYLHLDHFYSWISLPFVSAVLTLIQEKLFCIFIPLKPCKGTFFFELKCLQFHWAEWKYSVVSHNMNIILSSHTILSLHTLNMWNTQSVFFHYILINFTHFHFKLRNITV